jgi:hypothetical protein
MKKDEAKGTLRPLKKEVARQRQQLVPSLVCRVLCRVQSLQRVKTFFHPSLPQQQVRILLNLSVAKLTTCIVEANSLKIQGSLYPSLYECASKYAIFKFFI